MLHVGSADEEKNNWITMSRWKNVSLRVDVFDCRIPGGSCTIVPWSNIKVELTEEVSFDIRQIDLLYIR